MSKVSFAEPFEKGEGNACYLCCLQLSPHCPSPRLAIKDPEPAYVLLKTWMHENYEEITKKRTAVHKTSVIRRSCAEISYVCGQKHTHTHCLAGVVWCGKVKGVAAPLPSLTLYRQVVFGQPDTTKPPRDSTLSASQNMFLGHALTRGPWKTGAKMERCLIQRLTYI